MLYDASSSEYDICTGKRERHTSKSEFDYNDLRTSKTDLSTSYHALITISKSLVRVLFEIHMSITISSEMSRTVNI